MNMARRWFYTHRGQTHGPVAAAELKELVAAGTLAPDDRLWPEEFDPAYAITTARLLEALARRRAGGAGEAPAADQELPGWKQEIDQLFRAPEHAPAPVPDWLREMQPLPPSGPDPGAASAPGAPDWLRDLLPPDAEAAPAPPPLARPVTLPPGAPPPPLAQPVIPAAAGGEDLLERMGIDARTGAVVDPEKFERWQDEQRRRHFGELPAPAESDPDPFRTARRQLPAWLDLDKNQARLAAGDVEAVKRDPALQGFLAHFRRYGPEKAAHLAEYLDFLIEHRKRSGGR
jgi:hypothetical protein